MKKQHIAQDSVRDALTYLNDSGIHVPPFDLISNWEAMFGGSYVLQEGTSFQLNVGRFPLTFLRNWFAMHELGHIIWAKHNPTRRKSFKKHFGEPRPKNYEEIHRAEAWKTAVAYRLSWHPGVARPRGEPSWYGARAGGEERFCELIALMYAHGDFTKNPPPDLAELWDICWTYGLAKMN